MKILYFFFGVCGLLLGLLTMIKGGYNHHGVFLNLTESKYSVGSVFIVIGIFFIILLLRGEKKN